jgi:hypothetical protein
MHLRIDVAPIEEVSVAPETDRPSPLAHVMSQRG